MLARASLHPARAAVLGQGRLLFCWDGGRRTRDQGGAPLRTCCVRVRSERREGWGERRGGPGEAWCARNGRCLLHTCEQSGLVMSTSISRDS